MKDCQKCKSYKDCAGKPWYSYSDFRWCPWQVIWVIEQSEVLLAGNWPPAPDGSGYVDPKIKTGYGSEAYYAKPTSILAEVEVRLAKEVEIRLFEVINSPRIGVYGKLLIAEVKAGTELSELSDEAKSALMYIKGFRRKKQSYTQWMRDWRRGKTGKKFHKNVEIMGT